MTHTICPRCRKLWKISVSARPKDETVSVLCPECVADEARTVKRASCQ